MSETVTDARTVRIRQLNDQLRQEFIGGRIMLTPGVNELPDAAKRALLRAVSAFKAFNDDNDPYGEHDFGSVEIDGGRFFFKIDYYAPDMMHGSEDPADPAKTVRVMTLMRSDEY